MSEAYQDSDLRKDLMYMWQKRAWRVSRGCLANIVSVGLSWVYLLQDRRSNRIVPMHFLVSQLDKRDKHFKMYLGGMVSPSQGV